MMAICRRLDQEGLNLQRQGELGLWGPFAGHEAAQVGAALALEPTDWIFPYYRDFAMAVCRGISPASILTIYRGLRHGAWDPREYRFAPFIIPVGTQVPHAVGFALGCKLDREETAVLVGFGEGATSTGDWHEAMNFASVFHVPVVFFCENNQWAISVPHASASLGSHRRPRRGLRVPRCPSGRHRRAERLCRRTRRRRAGASGRWSLPGRGPYLPDSGSHDFGRSHSLPH